MSAPALHDPKTYAQGFPYEVFRELRDDDPVSHHDHPAWERGYWAITRHADVQRVSRDWNGFQNAPNPFLPDGPDANEEGSSLLMVSLDPPDHTKLRKLISSGFTPRRINDLAEQVKARVDSVINSVAHRGECDLVRDIALWLPLHAIADLVGVPEEDRKQIFEWTELTFGFDASVTPAERQDAAQSMFAYADAMCTERLDVRVQHRLSGRLAWTLSQFPSLAGSCTPSRRPRRPPRARSCNPSCRRPTSLEAS